MAHPHSSAPTPGVERRGTRGALALVGWLALAAAAGALGAVASRDAGTFYAVLARPAWAPPAWLFGPVWSALYVLMGVAAWLVWRERPDAPSVQRARRLGLALFVGQLALNALWTWLFFAWREGAWAFGEIVLLWLVVALTLWQFGRVRHLAAYCLAPYLAWVSFAAALTWSVWRANPGQL
jgi:benzodiazapine receptor